MELANGGLKGSALENFNTRGRTMANAHGGNLLMGQQIATLEYLRKAENGRLAKQPALESAGFPDTVQAFP